MRASSENLDLVREADLEISKLEESLVSVLRCGSETAAERPIPPSTSPLHNDLAMAQHGLHGLIGRLRNLRARLDL